MCGINNINMTMTTANISRIADTTLFSILIVALFCLIIISPVDAIYQCYRTRRLTNIFIIAGAYIVTFLLAAFIYASRIYTNRTVLASIPKAWIPIEKEDVGSNVRRLVEDGLWRSAIIAYQARPRDLFVEKEEEEEEEEEEQTVGRGGKRPGLAQSRFKYKYKELLVDKEHPPWGYIEHPGWSSPSFHSQQGEDMNMNMNVNAHLQYGVVVREIPRLIEARAVSLAPPDPRYQQDQEQLVDGDEVTTPIPPDTRVVDALRRPISMGLREYVEVLISIGLINSPRELVSDFINMYDWARFSTRDLYEIEFARLVRFFRDILSGMKPLDSQMVEDIRNRDDQSEVDGGSYSYSDSGSGPGPVIMDGESFLGSDDDDYSYSGESSVHRGRRHQRQSQGQGQGQGQPLDDDNDDDDDDASVTASSVQTHPGWNQRSPSLQSFSLGHNRSNVSSSNSDAGSVIRFDR